MSAVLQNLGQCENGIKAVVDDSDASSSQQHCSPGVLPCRSVVQCSSAAVTSVALMVKRRKNKLTKPVKKTIQQGNFEQHVSQYKYVNWQQATARYEGGWVAQIYIKGKGQAVVGGRQPTQLAAAKIAVSHLKQVLGKEAPTLKDLQKKAKKPTASRVREKRGVSQYLHVHWHSHHQLWQAIVDYVHLGYFSTDQEAAQKDLLQQKKLNITSCEGNLDSGTWV